MSRFLQALHSGRVLLMDGAMGTELIRAGLPPGEPCEIWNLSHPERVQAVHQAYVDAGAEVLLTNTFQANSSTLEWTGSRHTVNAAIGLAREVAASELFVFLDVGPLVTEYRRPDAAWLVQAGTRLSCDALLLETASDIADMGRIIKTRNQWGLKRDTLPILMSWTFRRTSASSPRTVNGWSPERCAEMSCRFGIVALGVNCGRDIGMDEIIEIVRRYRQVTDLPLFARPNAGTPKREGDRWVYPLTPAEMARRLPELLEAGVSMVGGCCGTTPKHIAAMRLVVDEWNRHII